MLIHGRCNVVEHADSVADSYGVMLDSFVPPCIIHVPVMCFSGLFFVIATSMRVTVTLT